MTKDSMHHRATKIIATLGPHSNIRAFAKTGVNVFRINASHGTHDEHAITIQTIRDIEKEIGVPLPVLFDLQGPKLRIGAVSPNVTLQEGELFLLDQNPLRGNHQRVCIPHPELFLVLKEGMVLLLNDGKIRLEILSVDARAIHTKVIVGGELTSCKGVNIPECKIPISALTEKDQKDLAFALLHDVDIIAVSFVQTPHDIHLVRDIVQGQALIIAKIEKPSAIDLLDSIIDAADGLMIARGDLGVELPLENVPWLQKKIIQKAREKGKPVIVATQMLESMILAPSPTRAEVSDVATAVMEGADAVMLSAESATGRYPIEAIQMMDRIICCQEQNEDYSLRSPQSLDGISDAIAAAAKQMATTLGAPLIVNLTSAGYTTFRLARQRPPALILVLSTSLRVARQMSLVWGTQCIVISCMMHDLLEIEDFVAHLTNPYIEKSMPIVILSNFLRKNGNTTNLLHIMYT